MREELELLPSRERRRYERESAEAQRRGERRARTRTLDEGLRLVELWLRDMLCVGEGAGELVYAVDRRDELARYAGGRDAASLARAVELVADTRLSLSRARVRGARAGGARVPAAGPLLRRGAGGTLTNAAAVGGSS